MISKNKSVEELVNAVRTLDENKRTIFYKIPDLTDFHPEEHTVNMGGSNFTMTEYALKQFLKKLKIPYSYYLACSPELRLKEVREGIETNGSPKVEYAFKVKEDKIYGIVSKAHCLHPSSHILGQLLPYIPEKLELKEFALNLEVLTMRFIVPTESFIENDTLQSAFNVGFSEVGAMPFKITSGIFRTSCENSLILKELASPTFKMPMTRYKQEVATNALSSIPNTMFYRMGPFMTVMEELKSLELPEALTNDGKLPHDLQIAFDLIVPSKAMQRNYITPMANYYTSDANFNYNGVLNAVTRTARDMDSMDKYAIERTAGNFITAIVEAKLKAERTRKEFTLDVKTLKELFGKDEG